MSDRLSSFFKIKIALVSNTQCSKVPWMFLAENGVQDYGVSWRHCCNLCIAPSERRTRVLWTSTISENSNRLQNAQHFCTKPVSTWRKNELSLFFNFKLVLLNLTNIFLGSVITLRITVWKANVRFWRHVPHCFVCLLAFQEFQLKFSLLVT